MKNEPVTSGPGLLPHIDLNEERRQERRQTFNRSRRKALVLSFLVVLAPAILLPWTLEAATLGAQQRKTERETLGMKARLASMTAADNDLEAQISRETQVVESRKARAAWSALLPALAACLPGDAALEQVQITDRGQSADMQIHGAAQTMAGLDAFTQALARSTLFDRLHLDETTVSRAKEAAGVSFQMSGPVSKGKNF